MAYYLIDFENVKSRGMEGVGAFDGGRYCLYFLQR